VIELVNTFLLKSLFEVVSVFKVTTCVHVHRARAKTCVLSSGCNY